jgi:hypothetical protein
MFVRFYIRQPLSPQPGRNTGVIAGQAAQALCAEYVDEENAEGQKHIPSGHGQIVCPTSVS